MSPSTYPNALPKPAHLQPRPTVKLPDAGRREKKPAVPVIRRLYWAGGSVAVGAVIAWLVGG